MSDIAVVGGLCVDISISPYSASVGRDSNPSRISVRVGGVGFNIASRLASLGHSPKLVCALGEDSFRPLIAKAAETARVELCPVKADSSGVYVCVNDPSGDMTVAYSDLSCTEDRVTPAALEHLLPMINACAACVLDGNLTSEAIGYLADNVRVPVFADPVSTKKALRFLPYLNRLAAIKPNIYEARALTGLKDPEECARALAAAGCGAAFVSCGAEGIRYADGSNCGFAPACPAEGNTTGAGDAACAMLIDAVLRGLTPAEAAAEANRFAAAHISKNTVQ